MGNIRDGVGVCGGGGVETSTVGAVSSTTVGATGGGGHNARGTTLVITSEISFICPALHRPRITLPVTSTLTLHPTTHLITSQTDVLLSPVTLLPLPTLSAVFWDLTVPKFATVRGREWLNLFSTGTPASEGTEPREDRGRWRVRRVRVKGGGEGEGKKPRLKEFVLTTPNDYTGYDDDDDDSSSSGLPTAQPPHPHLTYTTHLHDPTPGPTSLLSPTFFPESYPDTGFTSPGLRTVGPRRDSFAMTSGWEVWVGKGEGLRDEGEVPSYISIIRTFAHTYAH